MKNWKKVALLGAAAAAIAATGGAATPVVAGATSAGAAGAAGATGAAGVSGATGASGAGLFNGGLLGGGKTLIASGQTGILPATSGIGLTSGGLSQSAFGAGPAVTPTSVGTGLLGSAPDSQGYTWLKEPWNDPVQMQTLPDSQGYTMNKADGNGFMGGLKSAGQAAQAASAVKNLFPGEAPPPQMSQGNPAGPQTVAQVYQSGQQAVQDEINQAMQGRMQRRQNWG